MTNMMSLHISNRLRCPLCLFTFGLFLTSLGLLCAFLIFPLVLDNRIYRYYLDLWDKDSDGRERFVRTHSNSIFFASEKYFAIDFPHNLQFLT